MQSSTFFRAALLLIGALLVSACGGRVLATSWPNMSVEGDTLYIANSATVYAIDIQNGTARWQFPREASNVATQFYAEPTLTDDLVVVSSFNQVAFALDQQGAIQWDFDGEPVRTTTAPAATSSAHGFTYLVSGETLFALNLENGVEVWQFTADNSLWGPPSSNEDLLFLPSMDHSLYALDPATGTVVWQKEFEGALASMPTQEAGTLYVGSLSNNVYAVDAATGSLRWKVPTNGWVWSSPTIQGDRLYFGDLSGTVYAAEAETGRGIWTANLDSAIRGATAVSEDGAVFVNSEDGFVYSIDADNGALNWQVEIDPETGERLLANPVLADDLVIIAALNGTHLVYAYNQSTGALVWQFDPDR